LIKFHLPDIFTLPVLPDLHFKPVIGANHRPRWTRAATPPPLVPVVPENCQKDF
jgi:hypothetical protein